MVVIEDARSVSVRPDTDVDSGWHALDAVDAVQSTRRLSLRGRVRPRQPRQPNSRPPILAPPVTFHQTASRGQMPVQRGALVIMSMTFEPNIPVVVDSAHVHQCDCLYCSADHNLTEFELEENEVAD